MIQLCNPIFCIVIHFPVLFFWPHRKPQKYLLSFTSWKILFGRRMQDRPFLILWITSLHLYTLISIDLLHFCRLMLQMRYSERIWTRHREFLGSIICMFNNLLTEIRDVAKWEQTANNDEVMRWLWFSHCSSSTPTAANHKLQIPVTPWKIYCIQYVPNRGPWIKDTLHQPI